MYPKTMVKGDAGTPYRFWSRLTVFDINEEYVARDMGYITDPRSNS